MPFTVLIIDDLPFMRIIIRDILEKNGFIVVGEACHGLEGVKMYKENRPDIVLMDISMPVMNGIDALREIINVNSKANVIMCSAIGQQNMIIKSIQIGAKDFIVKPFGPERILSAVKKTLKIG